MYVSKCHFLIAGPETAVQHMHLSVGEEVIWESSQERLLGVLLDKLLKIHEHVLDICKKHHPNYQLSQDLQE